MVLDALAPQPATRRESAAATHAVLDWLTAQGAKHTERRVLDRLTERAAIGALPTAAWSPALTADGGIHDSAQVAELNGLLTLADGTRHAGDRASRTAKLQRPVAAAEEGQ
ncbi:hypothetical protein AB0B47_25305 [Micromonospora zamorensis]